MTNSLNLEENLQTEMEHKELERDILEMNEKGLVQYAGFWVRFWAYMIDVIVIGSLNRLIIGISSLILGIQSNPFDFFSYESVGTSMVLYGYYLVMTKKYGQTIGKMILGIKVITKTSQSLSWSDVIFRELIGKFISSFMLFIGYLMIGFTKEKKGLHDYIADSRVCYDRLKTK